MQPLDPAAATAEWLALLSPAEVARAIAYTRGAYWHVAGAFIVEVAVALLILRLGTLTALRNQLQVGRLRPLFGSFVVSLVFMAMTQLLALPWTAYISWYREVEFGLSDQSLGAWLLQFLIVGAVNALLFGILMIGVFAIIRAAPRTWVLWATGVVGTGAIALLVASPMFIEPLLNTYQPVPEGDVRQAILVLAEQTGTPSDKIHVYNGSLQSNRYTANVSGAFGSARIGISDTMLAKGTDIAEVRAVVGHEIAHYAHGHTLWLAGLTTLIVGLALFAVQRVFSTVMSLTKAKGVTGISDPAGLPIIAIIFACMTMLSTPLTNGISRALEEDADRFSLENAREPDGQASALINTAEYRAPSPGPLEEFLFYNHPSVERRIRAAMEWKAKQETPHGPLRLASMPGRLILTLKMNWGAV